MYRQIEVSGAGSPMNRAAFFAALETLIGFTIFLEETEVSDGFAEYFPGDSLRAFPRNMERTNLPGTLKVLAVANMKTGENPRFASGSEFK